MTMDYSPWVKREIWQFLKVAVSLKSERPLPPKLVCMGLYSHYNASLPGYSYLSLFSISFLFCMGMATIQLRLRTWFGVLASCARHS